MENPKPDGEALRTVGVFCVNHTINTPDTPGAPGAPGAPDGSQSLTIGLGSD